MGEIINPDTDQIENVPREVFKPRPIGNPRYKVQEDKIKDFTVTLMHGLLQSALAEGAGCCFGRVSLIYSAESSVL